MTSVSPAITPPVKPACALKTQTRVLPFLPAVSEVSSQLNPWTNCWWSSVTSLWRARNYPSGWPVAYVCPCLETCCNAVSLRWCCWSLSWSVRHWGETLRRLSDSKTTPINTMGRMQGRTWVKARSHYLWRVEVDIFSTAMFITRNSWLVIESLLHI